MISPKIQVKLTDVIGPSFYALYWDVLECRHTYYKLGGGRGSLKSTFAATAIINGMMNDAQNGKQTNAVVFRRNAIDLHDSVYEQLIWSIDRLQVSHLWRQTLSPLKLTYKPTGQVILFKGADKVIKRKSIKVSKGYIKYLWFEELDEFEGPEKIRSIRQSVVRGGEEFTVFYTYNPPKSQRSWVNDPVQWQRPDTVSHHSTYLEAPRKWLGEQFIIDAEHLKATKPDAYEHEYMGKVTGTGAEVFKNLICRKITDEEIAQFQNVRRGLDEGYASDPLAYNTVNYERKYKRLYIYDELYGAGISNRKAFEEISKRNKRNDPVNCDSAAPRFINELRQYGLRVMPVKKGPDSVEYGIKFLQDLEQIIIDPERCPNAWREFYGYELEFDSNGILKAEFPDRDNHTIDGVRYAEERDMLIWREEQKKRLSDPNNPTPKERYDKMVNSITGGSPSVKF
jgi:phage terminase large subunit